jgi:hypothetical protein
MMARVSVDRLARVLSLVEADLDGAPESERREAVRELAGCAIAAAADPSAYYEELAARFPLEEYMRQDEIASTPSSPPPSAPAPSMRVSGASMQTFTDALGVPPEAIEEERLLELAANWMQFTLAIDAAVRTIWREISKHVPSAELASVPAPAAIRTISAGFLSGSGAGAEEVRRHLDLLRRLISGMLMGLADAAKQHAQGQVRIFSPEAIRSTVPGKRNAAREAAYWKQYETLVESHHAADVQAVFGAIQRRLAEYVIETLSASAGSASRG